MGILGANDYWVRFEWQHRGSPRVHGLACCNLVYSEIENLELDVANLVTTCQRHTCCSAAYCLRTKNGRQDCRFGYLKPLQPSIILVTEDEPTLTTARNDGMVNSFNPVQFSAWRANVDMQYIVSRRKVIEYCRKYVTKSEPHSQSLKEVFTTIICSLKEGNHSLKAVQKLLINSVGERNFPPSRPVADAHGFVVRSLDGSRAQEQLTEQQFTIYS